MKAKNFTLFIGILLMANFSVNAQLNLTTGVPWGELNPTEALVLDENFQGFDFFHSDAQPDEGNSNHVLGDDGITIIPGYKNDSLEVPILGSTSGKIKYTFEECAFGPAWPTAYAFRDGGGQTPNVTDGFVEMSRLDTVYSSIPTLAGYFEVDLRELEYVEVIQWTHSSTGGSKRGIMCKYSIDDGITWDTLRYQPGDLWSDSFTKEIYSGTKYPNGYRCDPSAYGMTWEDGIYESNVMLRFEQATVNGGVTQTPRMHDLKVYGTYSPTTAVDNIVNPELKIYSSNKKIFISEQAEVHVFNISGSLVKVANRTNRISMEDMPIGIYLVKAKVAEGIKTAKVLIK